MTPDDAQREAALALLPYDRHSACPKCDHSEPLTEWHEAGPPYRRSQWGNERSCVRTAYIPWNPPIVWTYPDVDGKERTVTADGATWVITPSHLHRTCPNCRFEWEEAPTDASHLI